MDSVIKVEVTEPTEFTYAGYQTASWYTKYEIQQGIYEVVPWSNLPHYRHFHADAIVVEDYFASSWGHYAHYMPYDKTKNAGKADKVWVGYPATYESSDMLMRYLNYHPTFRVLNG